MAYRSAVTVLLSYVQPDARGPHAAQSKILCGPVQVFAVVKASYIVTTCPILRIFNLTFSMQVVLRAIFITSVAIANSNTLAILV